MTIPRNVFLDTSALFAGLWSASGGARVLLRLSEAGILHPIISQQVLAELDIALRQKAPHLLPVLAQVLDQSHVEIAEPASPELFQTCLKLCGHAGDARILADAWHAHAAYLVSLNQKHILNHPELSSALPYPIGTPGDFIQAYRDALGGYISGK